MHKASCAESKAQRKRSEEEAARGACMQPGEHQHFMNLTRSLHLFVSGDVESRRRFIELAPGPNAVLPKATTLPTLRSEEDYSRLGFVELGALWDAVFIQAEGSDGGARNPVVLTVGDRVSCNETPVSRFNL